MEFLLHCIRVPTSGRVTVVSVSPCRLALRVAEHRDRVDEFLTMTQLTWPDHTVYGHTGTARLSSYPRLTQTRSTPTALAGSNPSHPQQFNRVPCTL